MDSCFALIWAHQHTIDVHGFYRPGTLGEREEEPSDLRLMENPLVKHRSRIKGLSHIGG